MHSIFLLKERNLIKAAGSKLFYFACLLQILLCNKKFGPQLSTHASDSLGHGWMMFITHWTRNSKQQSNVWSLSWPQKVMTQLLASLQNKFVIYMCQEICVLAFPTWSVDKKDEVNLRKQWKEGHVFHWLCWGHFKTNKAWMCALKEIWSSR